MMARVLPLDLEVKQLGRVAWSRRNGLERLQEQELEEESLEVCQTQ